MREEIKYTMPEIENCKELFNNFMEKSETFIKKQKFIKRFGEDPVDVLGPDWENYLDEYLEEVDKEEFMIDRL